MVAPGFDIPESLAAFWREARERIEARLDEAIPPPGSSPAVLQEAMRHTALAPGKRIRGVLVLVAGTLGRGASIEPLLPLASAVELVHAASLILDDLPAMDDASVRRGRPALHRVVGEANAILAAVALLNSGYDEINRSALRSRARRDVMERLVGAIGADGLIGGQIVDLESTGRPLDLEALEYIHSHKTGALFTAAAEIGALGSGARARDVEALRRYAKNLGLAFQITDDLLDYSGDPATTGKDAGLDRDKTTFVDLCGIDGSRRLVDELIDASVESLSSLGRRAERLRALAEFVRSRDR